MQTKTKKVKWTIQVEVDEVWVADGFDFNQDCCQKVADNLIDYAYPEEVSVKVIKAPPTAKIRKIQGYDS